jgi:hypothetical protein
MSAPSHPAAPPPTAWAIAARITGAVLAVLLGAALAYFLAFNLRFITLPGAQEGREAAIPLTTALLLAGGSPYDLAHLPALTNLYGLVYNFAVLPAAALWGPTYAVHRTATLLFLLAGAALLCWVLRREGVGWPLALVGFAFYYLINATTYAISARPDTLGALLFLAAVSLVSAPRPGQPPFRVLAASAVLGVLAFYTKPYFVLGLPLAAAAVAVTSGWRRAALYAFGAGALLLTSSVLVNHFFPYYFFTVFTVNQYSAKNDPIYVWWQFIDFAQLHAGLLMVVVAVAVAASCRRFRPSQSSTIPKSPRHADPWPLNLLLALVAVEVMLGSHRGAFRAYWVQLITPFLLVVALRVIARASSPKWKTAGLSLLAFNAFLLLTWARPNWPENSAPAWAAWTQLTAGHPRQLLPPPLLDAANPAPPIVQDGQTLYFINAALDILPPDAPARQRVNQYINNLQQLIQNRYFDVIVLPGEFKNLIPPGLLAHHYQPSNLAFPCYFLPFYDPSQYGTAIDDYTVWIRQPGPAHASVAPPSHS